MEITLTTKKIKELANKIALTVDDNQLSPVSELLELEVVGKDLHVRTTNKEFFATVLIKDTVKTLNTDTKLSIMATEFLSLVSKITTDEIQLVLNKDGVILKSSGRYTFPLVLDGDVCATLPQIPFDGNVTHTFDVKGSDLMNMLEFNSKELSNVTIAKAIQKNYYWDNEGVLTFIESACINEFPISTQFKVLLPVRLVQLFRLFEDAGTVKVEMLKSEIGQDYQKNPIYRNKIRFSCNDVVIVSIIPEDELINKFPASAVKQLGKNVYPGEVVISKNLVVDALTRLKIFENSGGDLKKCAEFRFTDDGLIIISTESKNLELIPYKHKLSFVPFTSYISATDFAKHFAINVSDEANVLYGTGQAVMLVRKTFRTVIPEMTKPLSYDAGEVQV